MNLFALIGKLSLGFTASVIALALVDGLRTWWSGRRVQASAKRLGLAPQARGREANARPRRRADPARWSSRSPDLLPPAGSWCGCCGRPCDETVLWCLDCAAHVGRRGQPHERTWFAMHGEDCPFTERHDEGDGDIVPEGLGVPGIAIRPIDCARERHHPLGHRTLNIAFLYDWEWDLWTDVIVQLEVKQ